MVNTEFEKFNDPNYGDNSGRGNGGGYRDGGRGARY